MIKDTGNLNDGQEIQAVTGRIQAEPAGPLGSKGTEAQKFTISDSTGSIECTMWLPSKSGVDMMQFNGKTVTIGHTGKYGEITVCEYKGKRSLRVGNKCSIVDSGSTETVAQGNSGTMGGSSSPVAANQGEQISFSEACDIGVKLASPALVIAEALTANPEEQASGYTNALVWSTLFNALFAGKITYDDLQDG